MTAQTVAQYIDGLVNAAGKTQSQIAKDAGFVNPNIITMIKQGRTKLPVERIPALSKALSVDMGEMVALAMSEYYPELYGALRARMEARAAKSH